MTNIVDSTTRPATARTKRRRTLSAVTLGHVIESFDFGVYAYMATTVAVIFFPSESKFVSLLAVFAVFAVPFLARPLGGVIFGQLGDRVGRRATLVATITMMGLGSGLIGLLPGYAAIGFWAPLFLVVLRLVQGLSMGGETAGAITYAVESAPKGSRGFWGSIAASGSMQGAVLAAGTVLALNAALTPAQILDWGWRLPFLLAFPLASIALYLRLKVDDSPAFLEAMKDGRTERTPVRTAIKSNGGTILRLFALCSVMTVGAYLSMVYVITYLMAELHYSAIMASGVTSAGILIIIFFYPVVGRLSDRVGRRRVIRAGLVGLFVLSLPGLLLMGATSGFVTVLLGYLVLLVPTLLVQSTTYTYMAEMFPVGVRFSGMALAFNAGAVVGGLAPFLATLLIGITGSVLVPAFILMAMAPIGMIAIQGLQETAQSDLT